MATKSKIATLIEQVFRDSGRGDEAANIKRAVDDARFVDHINPIEERLVYALRGAGFRLVEDDDENYVLPLRLQPSGITPALQEQLDAIDASIRTHEREVSRLEDLRRTTAQDFVIEVLPEPKPNKDDLSFSQTWECDGSPTGYCVYNDVEDPINDSCVFCGQPDERK